MSDSASHAANSQIPLLLRPRDAARALSISERTLWTLAKRGELRSVKIGRAVAYSIDELRAFIAKRMEGKGVKHGR